VDLAVINGNYAIEAGLSVDDALAKEEKDSDAATTYANIVVIRRDDENRADLIALARAITSDAVRRFIDETYAGAVLPVF
jgi:D-methionine transport system substrate-binding protein